MLSGGRYDEIAQRRRGEEEEEGEEADYSGH